MLIGRTAQRGQASTHYHCRHTKSWTRDVAGTQGGDLGLSSASTSLFYSLSPFHKLWATQPFVKY